MYLYIAISIIFCGTLIGYESDDDRAFKTPPVKPWSSEKDLQKSVQHQLSAWLTQLVECPSNWDETTASWNPKLIPNKNGTVESDVHLPAWKDKFVYWAQQWPAPKLRTYLETTQRMLQRLITGDHNPDESIVEMDDEASESPPSTEEMPCYQNAWNGGISAWNPHITYPYDLYKKKETWKEKLTRLTKPLKKALQSMGLAAKEAIDPNSSFTTLEDWVKHKEPGESFTLQDAWRGGWYFAKDTNHLDKSVSPPAQTLYNAFYVFSWLKTFNKMIKMEYDLSRTKEHGMGHYFGTYRSHALKLFHEVIAEQQTANVIRPTFFVNWLNKIEKDRGLYLSSPFADHCITATVAAAFTTFVCGIIYFSYWNYLRGLEREAHKYDYLEPVWKVFNIICQA